MLENVFLHTFQLEIRSARIHCLLFPPQSCFAFVLLLDDCRDSAKKSENNVRHLNSCSRRFSSETASHWDFIPYKNKLEDVSNGMLVLSSKYLDRYRDSERFVACFRSEVRGNCGTADMASDTSIWPNYSSRRVRQRESSTATSSSS